MDQTLWQYLYILLLCQFLVLSPEKKKVSIKMVKLSKRVNSHDSSILSLVSLCQLRRGISIFFASQLATVIRLIFNPRLKLGKMQFRKIEIDAVQV